MSEPTPYVFQDVTQYAVSMLPLNAEERDMFEIKVQWRGRGLWAVTRHSSCQNSAGAFAYEPSPSNRDAEWLDDNRFTLGDALDRAREACQHIIVNGHHVSDVRAALEATDV